MLRLPKARSYARQAKIPLLGLISALFTYAQVQAFGWVS